MNKHTVKLPIKERCQTITRKLLFILYTPVPFFRWLWNFCSWWPLLLTFLKVVFKMTLCFNVDRKILHPGDQFQSLRNSIISHRWAWRMCQVISRAKAVSRPLTKESDSMPMAWGKPRVSESVLFHTNY